jgi:hypothetical protein
MVPEICQLENIKHYTQAWQMIRTVRSQLRSNEISLLDVTPEERGAAKKHLDVKRNKKQGKTSDYY